MASSQVIYAPPAMQERLPSIRDLNIPVRPPRQQQSQSQGATHSQPQQQGESSSSQSHTYGRRRPQASSWSSAQAIQSPYSPVHPGQYIGAPVASQAAGSSMMIPSTTHPGVVHSREEVVIQDSHTQTRQRSESRASTASISPSMNRPPHSAFQPRQYSGPQQHGIISYSSSIPPSPHQSHLQHSQPPHPQMAPSSPVPSASTSQQYQSQGPPNYASVQLTGPQAHSGYTSYHPQYAAAPPHPAAGPLSQPQQVHSQPVSSPSGLSSGIYQPDHWQQPSSYAHSSGHSPTQIQQHHQVLHPSHLPHPVHLQQHSHQHHAPQVHQSPHQHYHQSQPPPPSQPQSQAYDQPHESAQGNVPDIVPSAGEQVHSRPPDTAPLSESFPTGQLDKDEMRLNFLKQIAENCSIILKFTDQYQTPSTSPPFQADPAEVAEMRQKADLIVSLLEELRKLSLSEEDAQKEEDTVPYATAEGRPPKRPWEDMMDESENVPPQAAFIGSSSSSLTMAEKDMEIIRSKRATNPTSIPSDAPKGKYRKRSRASPPGKCHSCNIRETPEWRRGPDGARTLCNACGLHYAKLMRKRDKAGPDGRPVHIDLETLRASTKLASEKDKSQAVRQKRPQESENEQASSSQQMPELQSRHTTASPGNVKVESPTVHPFMHTGSSATTTQQRTSNVTETGTSNAPPSSWPSNPSSRGYSTEQQSYMRSTPSHSRSSLS